MNLNRKNRTVKSREFILFLLVAQLLNFNLIQMNLGLLAGTCL